MGKRLIAWENTEEKVCDEQPPGSGGLSSEEEEIANLIASAWNRFIKLKQSHPDDKKDFHRGVHELQKVLGMRVLRRQYPDYWINKGGE